MDAKKTFNVTQFEVITESKEILIGGFTTSFSLSSLDVNSSVEGSNNCLGGNCSYYCGDNQNIKCNVASGCSN